MKRVTAFVGSARKKNTYKAVEQFLNNLQALGEIETEIVVLCNYNLGICKGCQLCFNKGEEFCPLQDDRDVLFDKIAASDGVIFATPNYTWNMSGIMKIFCDRFGFACHRPRWFGKAFTSIVVQAVARGDKIVDYFNFTARVLGFNALKGMVITAFDPRTEKQQKKIDRDLAEHSQRFYALLSRPAYPAPSWLQLLLFRIGRSMMLGQADPASVDYQYFAKKGWFESDYYYPVKLGWLKQFAGSFLDRLTPTLQKMIA